MATDSVSATQEVSLRADSLADNGFEWSTPEDRALFQSDEFRLYCCKVLPCPKSHPHEWKTCPFAHRNEAARRRDPRVYQYVDVLCPDLKKKKRCPRSDDCCYSHNLFEYWMHPRRYRTQLCNDGESCQRQLCFFAHTLQQLRPRPEGENSSAEVEVGQPMMMQGSTSHSLQPDDLVERLDSDGSYDAPVDTTPTLGMSSTYSRIGTTQSAPTSPPRDESDDGDHQPTNLAADACKILEKLQRVLPSGVPASRRRNSDTATMLMSAFGAQDGSGSDLPPNEALHEALKMLATLSSEARRPVNPARQQRPAARNHRSAMARPSAASRYPAHIGSYMQPPVSTGLALAISNMPSNGVSGLAMPQQSVQYIIDSNGQLQLATIPVLVMTKPMTVCDSSLSPQLLTLRVDHPQPLMSQAQAHVQHMLPQVQAMQSARPQLVAVTTHPHDTTQVRDPAVSWSGNSSMQEFAMLYHQLQSLNM